MSYQWRGHARNAGVSADIAGEELERIRIANNGRLEPEPVVEESRPNEAPLHPVFEWDDPVAAEQYRLWQARALIRSIRVVRTNGTEHNDPAYVHVRSQDESYYQSTEVAVKNVDEWSSALRELHAKLTALTNALEDLRRISGKTGKASAASVIELTERALSMAQRAIDKLAA